MILIQPIFPTHLSDFQLQEFIANLLLVATFASFRQLNSTA